MTPRKKAAPLRAVKPDERKPARKKPANVLEAVKSGTLREQLVAMQERIATAIDDPLIRGADLAALTRRLHEITNQIAALDAQLEQDGGDDGPVADETFDASAL